MKRQQEKVLVTGADGMLGSHIIRELLNRGYSVNALLQPGRSTQTLDGLDLQITQADIRDMDRVWEAMRGCDYVIHAAASIAMWPARSRLVYEVNLEGTMNIVWAAKALQVKRLVHVSSAAVFGPVGNPAIADENSAFNGDRYGLDYINSKYDAHQLVVKATKAGLNAVIVNPTFMLGSYDSGQGSSSLLLAVKKGKMMAFPPGGKNFVCASDVAHATVNALHKGRSGESYILGNANLSYKEMLSLAARIVNGNPPKFQAPAAVVRFAGSVNNLLYTVLGIRPQISKQMAHISCCKQFFSCQKAVHELQLRQTPIEQGIRDAWQWYKQKGLIQD